MNEHVLLAYKFENGQSISLDGNEIAVQLRSTANLAWLHLDATHPNTRSWLEKEVDYLDSVTIEALLADETRPRMTQVNNGVLLILRGVNLNQDSQPEDMVSIRLWIDQYRIISLRRRRLKAISDIDKDIKSGIAPKNAGDFVCKLVSRLFIRMEPVLIELDDLTDDVEEKILESVNAELRENIVNVRKQAILFRRYMAPQKDAIGQLRMAEVDWLKDIHKRQLFESYNHVTRYVEDLDAIRERAQIVKDEMANIKSDMLNKNMYMLSVIAAIFLPLGFLTGLLGINIGGIPGADNGNAFWIFCGILVVIVSFQIFIFKKLKWI
jgi:zinc transporter